MLGLKRVAETGVSIVKGCADARLVAAKRFVEALSMTENALGELRAADLAFYSADAAKVVEMSGIQRQAATVLPLFLLGHMQFETPELFRLLNLQAPPASARGRLDEYLARAIATDLDLMLETPDA